MKNYETAQLTRTVPSLYTMYAVIYDGVVYFTTQPVDRAYRIEILVASDMIRSIITLLIIPYRRAVLQSLL